MPLSPNVLQAMAAINDKQKAAGPMQQARGSGYSEPSSEFSYYSQGGFDEPNGECRKSGESASKPRLELVPWTAVSEIAEVLTFGADKYGANNWCRGARWGRYFAALCRHIFAWWRGENLDPETGKSHLAHAGCCLLFLMEYQRNDWGSDDRFKGPDEAPFQKSDGVTD
jgi:hypothetical protein